ALLVGRLPWAQAALARRVAAALLAADTVLAAWMAIAVVAAGAPFTGPHATWIDTGALSFGVGVYVDPMGAVMALIVCGLATAVLVFNAWYMHGDELAARFPRQFCLFAFAMLGVVLRRNLLLTFCS